MESFLSSKKQSWLSWFLRGFLIFGFLVLISRLVDLTIIRGDYYRTLSEGNRIRRVPIVATRGRIMARGGEVLVGNKSNDKKRTSEDQMIVDWTRDYLLGSDFAHVSGFLGEVTKEELGKVKAQCPDKGPRKLGSYVGRGGLEEEYDCSLRGVDGEELVEVDAQGKKVRIIGRRDPLVGDDLRTSIHYGLQKKVAKLMNDEKGAIVVSDSMGEILALYSAPSFDPNVFITGDAESINRILSDRELPLFNRVLGGIYHPGSVFKPVVAVAALEEGKIDENFLYEDAGQIIIDTPYGKFDYKNWYFTQYGAVEGEIDITRALARSTDTFFYKLGEFLGVEKIGFWAAKFGLSEKTGIDLPGEIAGLIPSPSWKLRVKGESWFLGNTYHMSIGQGDVAITPLAINAAISAIARNGVYCQPHLAIEERLGNDKCVELEINKKSIDLVKKGMIGACSPEGTSVAFFDFSKIYGIDVACKTGTAETEEKDKTHAWFVVFAPVDFPEIVVTVLVEKGGEGSKIAAPIAREIFDYWFENGNKE
jgi:penicillin-binding protein 2